MQMPKSVELIYHFNKGLREMLFYFWNSRKQLLCLEACSCTVCRSCKRLYQYSNPRGRDKKPKTKKILINNKTFTFESLFPPRSTQDNCPFFTARCLFFSSPTPLTNLNRWLIFLIEFILTFLNCFQYWMGNCILVQLLL